MLKNKLINTLYSYGVGKQYGWIIVDYIDAFTARYIYQSNKR